MKICLATGIYPPEIGGPAQYAYNLARAFEAEGHSVTVVTYGALKKLPTGIRHLAYTARLVPAAFHSDAILAFDTYSVALPAAVVSLLVRIPLVIRIGGDFLWEGYVERTKDLMPLTQFYANAKKWGTKERVVFALTRWVLSHATAVFNSEWLAGIWRDAYGLSPQRAAVVENEMQPAARGGIPQKKNFLFYSRPIALKNSPAFKRAFAAAQLKYPDIVLEEGTVPHEELLQRMKDCYAVVCPSISDVAPNYVLDALRFGKPFLLTKHSGYAERFGKYGVIIDPLSVDDMARGVMQLADDVRYKDLKNRIREHSEIRTYSDVARDFLSITQKI